MATLTIRGLKEDTYLGIKKQAAAQNLSMEEHARRILMRETNNDQEQPGQLARRIHQRLAAIEGIEDLELPERTPLPDPLNFPE